VDTSIYDIIKNYFYGIEMQYLKKGSYT